MEETEKYGGYPTSDGFNGPRGLVEDKVPIPKETQIHMLENFGNGGTNLYHDLHTFRITGGEPLLSRDTWKVLDYIIEQKNPNDNLQFEKVNSNLGALTS